MWDVGTVKASLTRQRIAEYEYGIDCTFKWVVRSLFLYFVKLNGAGWIFPLSLSLVSPNAAGNCELHMLHAQAKVLNLMDPSSFAKITTLFKTCFRAAVQFHRGLPHVRIPGIIRIQQFHDSTISIGSTRLEINQVHRLSHQTDRRWSKLIKSPSLACNMKPAGLTTSGLWFVEIRSWKCLTI